MQKTLSSCLIILSCLFTQYSFAERSSLIIDVKTNHVLHARNINLPAYPASLTKLMTLYLMFEAIDNQKLLLSDSLTISRSARSQKGSRIGLKKADTITVKEAILALIVQSANDVAIVVAEALANNEGDFVHKMNLRAALLGMKDTVFKNPSGLPDPEQMTTARDMAVLALAIYQRFPRYFHFFSVKTFSFGKRTFKTHNRFTLSYSGAHGLKTGYTCNAGFNLVTLVRRKKQELIGVILGEESHKDRDNLMQVLMDHSLEHTGKNSKHVSSLTIDKMRHSNAQGAGSVANIEAIARNCKRI